MNEYLVKKNFRLAKRYNKLEPKEQKDFTIYTNQYFEIEQVNLYDEDKKNNICLLLAFSAKSVEEFIGCTNFNHYFVIYPNEQVYYNNFVSYSMDNLHKNEKYKPIVSDDNLQSYIFANLDKYRFSAMGTSFVILNKKEWEQNHSDVLSGIINSLVYLINHEKLNINTNHFHAKKQTFNQYKNLQKTLNYPTIEILKDKLEGNPCICVGAGGSLAKNIDFLKKIQGKVFIICCINVLKPLLLKGVKPDIVTALDFNILTKEFCSDCDCKDLLLVSDVSSYHKTTDFFDKNIICLSSVAHKETLINYYKNIGVDVEDAGKIKTAFSVAFFSVNIANYMGASEIILLGQDLACEYDKSHVDGYMFNRKFDNARWNIPVKAWDGKGTALTDITFKIYREFFELSIPQYKSKIYNCTEGGAYIQGCEHISLREAKELLIKEENKHSVCYKAKNINHSFDELRKSVRLMLVSLKGGIEYINMYKKEHNELIKKGIAIKINNIKSEIVNNPFFLGLCSEQRNSLYDLYVYLQSQKKDNSDVVLAMYVLFKHIVNTLSLFEQSFVLDNIQSEKELENYLKEVEGK